jgi:hypothetical protein
MSTSTGPRSSVEIRASIGSVLVGCFLCIIINAVFYDQSRAWYVVVVGSPEGETFVLPCGRILLSLAVEVINEF